MYKHFKKVKKMRLSIIFITNKNKPNECPTFLFWLGLVDSC